MNEYLQQLDHHEKRLGDINQILKEEHREATTTDLHNEVKSIGVQNVGEPHVHNEAREQLQDTNATTTGEFESISHDITLEEVPPHTKSSSKQSLFGGITHAIYDFQRDLTREFDHSLAGIYDTDAKNVIRIVKDKNESLRKAA